MSQFMSAQVFFGAECFQAPLFIAGKWPLIAVCHHVHFEVTCTRCNIIENAKHTWDLPYANHVIKCTSKLAPRLRALALVHLSTSASPGKSCIISTVYYFKSICTQHVVPFCVNILLHSKQRKVLGWPFSKPLGGRPLFDTTATTINKNRSFSTKNTPVIITRLPPSQS